MQNIYFNTCKSKNKNPIVIYIINISNLRVTVTIHGINEVININYGYKYIVKQNEKTFKDEH